MKQTKNPRHLYCVISNNNFGSNKLKTIQKCLDLHFISKTPEQLTGWEITCMNLSQSISLIKWKTSIWHTHLCVRYRFSSYINDIGVNCYVTFHTQNSVYVCQYVIAKKQAKYAAVFQCLHQSKMDGSTAVNTKPQRDQAQQLILLWFLNTANYFSDVSVNVGQQFKQMRNIKIEEVVSSNVHVHSIQ